MVGRFYSQFSKSQDLKHLPSVVFTFSLSSDFLFGLFFCIQIALTFLYLLQKGTFCRLTGLQPYRLQIMVFSTSHLGLYLGF